MTTHPVFSPDTQVTAIDADLADGLALPEDFEELARVHGVREADMPEVKALSLSVFAHKRLDAAGAFAFGAALVAIEAYFDEEAFEEFAPKAYEYSLKHVRSYQKVASELGPWRSRAIRVEFKSTHLIRMLARTPEERDAILAKAEAGEKVTVADVENWGKPKEEPVDPMSSGGIKGLRALAQAKAKAGSASFGANVGTVLAAIDEALATGKSIVKMELAKEIQKPARQASGELRNLALFVAPGPFGDVEPLRFPDASDWGKVYAVLDQVGHYEQWPGKPELKGWLTDTVLPVLRWAVSGSGPMSAPTAEAEPVVEAIEVGSPILAKADAETTPPVEAADGKGKRPKAAASKSGKKASTPRGKRKVDATDAPLAPDLSDGVSSPTPA